MDEERVRAINKIEERVCADLHEGQVPKLLMHLLFAKLREALAEGNLFAQVTRKRALQWVDKQHKDAVSESTFKNAVLKIGTALEACRPLDLSLMPLTDRRPGVACTDAII